LAICAERLLGALLGLQRGEGLARLALLARALGLLARGLGALEQRLGLDVQALPVDRVGGIAHEVVDDLELCHRTGVVRARDHQLGLLQAVLRVGAHLLHAQLVELGQLLRGRLVRADLLALEREDLGAQLLRGEAVGLELERALDLALRVVEAHVGQQLARLRHVLLDQDRGALLAQRDLLRVAGQLPRGLLGRGLGLLRARAGTRLGGAGLVRGLATEAEQQAEDQGEVRLPHRWNLESGRVVRVGGRSRR
jgi:hypothetical protein